MVDAEPNDNAVHARLRAELSAVLLHDDRFRERFVQVLEDTEEAQAAFASDLRFSIVQILRGAYPEDGSSHATLLAESESIANSAMDDLTRSIRGGPRERT